MKKQVLFSQDLSHDGSKEKVFLSPLKSSEVNEQLSESDVTEYRQLFSEYGTTPAYLKDPTSKFSSKSLVG